MKFPAAAVGLTLAVVAVAAADVEKVAPTEEAKLVQKTGGVRKGRRRRRRLQNRSICDAEGQINHSGLVPTAPSYTDCYMNGCPAANACSTSSQCAPGACCMPTSWIFYGNYCVNVAQLDALNEYTKRKCICSDDRTGGAIVAADEATTVQTEGTGTGGVGGDGQTVQQTDSAGLNKDTPQGDDESIEANTDNTDSDDDGCDGCLFEGRCEPTGTAWMLEDGCTYCNCGNADGEGEYQCYDSQCRTAETEKETETGTSEGEDAQTNSPVATTEEVLVTNSTEVGTAQNTQTQQVETNDEQGGASAGEGEGAGGEGGGGGGGGGDDDSPSPPTCDGCSFNSLCLPTGAQWVMTDTGCSRQCVCLNRDGSGDVQCAQCPPPPSSGGGAATGSAESTRLVPGFGGVDGGVGEEDGGGGTVADIDTDILQDELNILNQPLLLP